MFSAQREGFSLDFCLIRSMRKTESFFAGALSNRILALRSATSTEEGADPRISGADPRLWCGHVMVRKNEGTSW